MKHIVQINVIFRRDAPIRQATAVGKHWWEQLEWEKAFKTSSESAAFSMYASQIFMGLMDGRMYVFFVLYYSRATCKTHCKHNLKQAMQQAYNKIFYAYSVSFYNLVIFFCIVSNRCY